MSNQQSNYYGTNPQSMTPEQWSVYQQQLLNWQYNQYQQSSYQHQFQQQPVSRYIFDLYIKFRNFRIFGT